MAIELYNDEVKVKHLLKADPFGQAITVYNKENNDKANNLVDDTDDFFAHIYKDASGTLNINNIKQNLTIDKWLEDNDNFSNSLNCLLFFIEGYAGCGKSTLVQHILYKVLDNPNYEYSYYNYDIGSYPDDNTDIYNMNVIKSSILIRLVNQIIAILTTREGYNIFNKFLYLMEDEDSLKMLDGTLQIKRKFGTTQAFTSSVDSILNCNYDKKSRISDLKTSMEMQLENLTTYQLLCIDYLWRLAQYLVDARSYRKYMYVCYDNLDSIMNYDVLCDFKDQLVMFRDNLNTYISTLNRNIRNSLIPYGDDIKRIRPFIIFTTYRKITAIRSNNRKNTEMLDDMTANSPYIQIIDVSKQYDFTQMAEKRITHFSNKLVSTNICGSRANNLVHQMKTVDDLKKMNFVRSTYAGLWNNNLRSCSNVLSDLIDYNDAEINKCKDLCLKNVDGHIPDRYCYFGASSLFLHAICKLLKEMYIFDSNHLDLINIKEDTLKRQTSLSRLIITYLDTKNISISITELFDAFDRIFEPQYICKILGQLMTRVEGEIWRRPIYYSKNALDNEIDIQNKLYKQYENHQAGKEYKYVEFKICDCGSTYINAIVPHFEFYSVRINEKHQNLYCVEELDKLKTILKDVYEKIEICCNKQIEFAEDYIKKYNIDKTKYLSLPFHPRTRLGNPQLHIERVIFSHIAYLNKYRMFLISKKEPKKYDEFNENLLSTISKYLKLYNRYVLKISDERIEIAKKMQSKIDIANTSNKYISIET